MAIEFMLHPTTSTILIEKLGTFFTEKMPFNSLFPKNDLKITSEHPFVDLMQATNSTPAMVKSKFPSLIVINTNSGYCLDLAVTYRETVFDIKLLEDLQTHRGDRYICSDRTVCLIEQAFKESDTLSANMFNVPRQDQIVLELWTTNSIMSKKTYSILHTVLLGDIRKWLHDEYAIELDITTIGGEPEGIYNLDFGERLYGSKLFFSLQYMTTQFTIDKCIDIDEVVVHTNPE